MRRNIWVRTGTMSMLALGISGASIVGVGVGAASAAGGGARGTYSFTFQWAGESQATTSLTLGAKHKYSDGQGGTGTYNYLHHHLTLKYSGACGAVYKGAGTPAGGFSGTSIIKNNAPGCLAQGTTGTWSTCPVAGPAIHAAVHGLGSTSGAR